MLYHIHLQSQYLDRYTDLNVLVPNKPKDLSPAEFYRSGEKYRVLWLLHGHGSDYSDWQRKSNIELYSRDYNLIVVMPSVGNTLYTSFDLPMMSLDSYHYLTEELMPLVYGWFPASDKPEDNFIAGFSMGSMGTFKFVANNPGLFAGAACLSGCPVNFREVPTEGDPLSGVVQEALLANGGSMEALLASADNAWDRLVENKDQLPPIYCCCGTADPFYEADYVPFKRHAQEAGLPITFHETDGAGHDFWFWDPQIRRALEFWGIAKPGEQMTSDRGL